jgi:glycerol-3-phosphate acyltransferase PlsY
MSLGDFRLGWAALLCAVLAYLLGSIPFGLILARLGGHGDIRKIGSGNIGATNVLRTGDKKLAALTLLFDAGKGACAVLLARNFGAEMAAISAVFVLLGHLLPVWLRFRGGKGVATAGGVLLAYAWPVGLAALATWLLIAVLTRYSSAAALGAAVLAPVYAALLAPGQGTLLVSLFITLVIILSHRANILRLLRGTESRIELRKPQG